MSSRDFPFDLVDFDALGNHFGGTWGKKTSKGAKTILVPEHKADVDSSVPPHVLSSAIGG